MSSLVSIIPVILFVLFIMASGYFHIYNVFYISVTNDIEWFGMMKTIGATAPQIRRIMGKQVRLLAAIGIAAGIAAGYIAGLRIAPKVVGMTDWAVYYKAPGFLGISVFAAVFSWLTVQVSANKPLRLAAAISPIEAARFTPKSSKNIFTVISLALSGIIFLAAANVSIGFEPDVYVDRYNQNDYQIMHKGALWVLEEEYKPISGSLKTGLEALPFVERVDAVYTARTFAEKTGQMYPFSQGEIKAQGGLFDYFYEAGGEPAGETFPLVIAGLPPERWTTEKVNYKVLEGELNIEKFAEGDSIIVHSGEKAPDGKELHAGDVLTLSVYRNEEDAFYEKEVCVLAVIDAAHEYSSSDVLNADIIIPDFLFQDVYSNYEEMLTSLQVTAKEELEAEEVARIRELIQEQHNTQLRVASRYDWRKESLNTKQTYGFIGFFTAGIRAIVGLSNVVNTVTAGVLAHRLEYACMQSVGMTRRQLAARLFGEGMKYCGAALIIMVPVGAAAAYMLAQSPLFTGFNSSLFVMHVLITVAALLCICLVQALILTKVLNRKSVVERLREIE